MPGFVIKRKVLVRYSVASPLFLNGQIESAVILSVHRKQLKTEGESDNYVNGRVTFLNYKSQTILTAKKAGLSTESSSFKGPSEVHDSLDDWNSCVSPFAMEF